MTPEQLISGWAPGGYDALTESDFAALAALKPEIALFGSGTSTTHNARNYPLVLAGGKNLGLKHGRFIKQKAERPLGDLFLTLLHRFDVPAKSFADNAGEFREILAS